MSERRLKLGHRKEYTRKSKHTRNPSYYPRHLTKAELSVCNKTCSLALTVGWLQNTSLGMTISV